jgi:hypothetical protein
MRNEATEVHTTSFCWTERQPEVQSRAERTEGTKRLIHAKTCTFPTQLELCSYTSLQEVITRILDQLLLSIYLLSSLFPNNELSLWIANLFLVLNTELWLAVADGIREGQCTIKLLSLALLQSSSSEDTEAIKALASAIQLDRHLEHLMLDMETISRMTWSW